MQLSTFAATKYPSGITAGAAINVERYTRCAVEKYVAHEAELLGGAMLLHQAAVIE